MQLFSQCNRSQCPQVAGALTFTTLLALVPLMTVAFSIFSALPFFTDWLDSVEQFVLDIFVPTVGEGVREHLLSFVHKASTFSDVSSLGVFITAVLMLNTIDTALNRIWHVRRTPRTILRLLVFMLILVLGPPLIAVSLAATTFLVTLPYIPEVVIDLEVRGFILSLLPVVVTTLMLGFLYHWVPNTPVRWSYALIGGLVAAILFEGAKYGFALYFTWIPTYEFLYGALAAIPLLLIWIYLSWLIVLFGAEITYNLEIFQYANASAEGGSELVPAFRLLGHLWRAQPAAVGLQQLSAMDNWQGIRLSPLLEKLRKIRMVKRQGKDRWLLAAEFNRFSLFDLYKRMATLELQCDGHWAERDEWNSNLNRALKELIEEENHIRSVSLVSLYTPAEAVEPGEGNNAVCESTVDDNNKYN